MNPVINDVALAINVGIGAFFAVRGDALWVALNAFAVALNIAGRLHACPA